MNIEEHIPYQAVEGYDPSLNTLDIYYTPLSNRQPKRPVVVFLHGGNWAGGDKACFLGPKDQTMPAWFVKQGYVFVAVNFRLAGSPRSPDANVADMVSDVAKAIKWLTVNGRRYGGQQSGFILLGYSSGAHLATLLAAKESSLRGYRLQSRELRGVIALDVPHFDVPLALEVLCTEDVGLQHQGLRLAMLNKILGNTRAAQESVSPAAHLGPWLRETSFLLLSAGLYQGCRQSFSRRMSEHFRDLLLTQGLDAEHCHFEEYDHTDFIGRFCGDVSGCVANFLQRIRVPS